MGVGRREKEVRESYEREEEEDKRGRGNDLERRGRRKEAELWKGETWGEEDEGRLTGRGGAGEGRFVMTVSRDRRNGRPRK